MHASALIAILVSFSGLTASFAAPTGYSSGPKGSLIVVSTGDILSDNDGNQLALVGDNSQVCSQNGGEENDGGCDLKSVLIPPPKKHPRSIDDRSSGLLDLSIDDILSGNNGNQASLGGDNSQTCSQNGGVWNDGGCYFKTVVTAPPPKHKSPKYPSEHPSEHPSKRGRGSGGPLLDLDIDDILSGNNGNQLAVGGDNEQTCSQNGGYWNDGGCYFKKVVVSPPRKKVAYVKRTGGGYGGGGLIAIDLGDILSDNNGNQLALMGDNEQTCSQNGGVWNDGGCYLKITTTPPPKKEVHHKRTGSGGSLVAIDLGDILSDNNGNQLALMGNNEQTCSQNGGKWNNGGCEFKIVYTPPPKHKGY